MMAEGPSAKRPPHCRRSATSGCSPWGCLSCCPDRAVRPAGRPGAGGGDPDTGRASGASSHGARPHGLNRLREGRGGAAGARPSPMPRAARTRMADFAGRGPGDQPLGHLVPALRGGDAGAGPRPGRAGGERDRGAGAVLGPRRAGGGGGLLRAHRAPAPWHLARSARRGGAGARVARPADHHHRRPRRAGARAAGGRGRLGRAGDARRDPPPGDAARPPAPDRV